MTEPSEIVCRRSLGWAGGVLRLGFGVLFLALGIGKFLHGYTAWVSRGAAAFAGTWLPGIVTTPFLHLLPFLEIALGSLLVVGLLSGLALRLTGLLVVSLVLGVVVRGDSGDGIRNLMLLGAWAIAMGLHPWDHLSLDALRKDDREA